MLSNIDTSSQQCNHKEPPSMDLDSNNDTECENSVNDSDNLDEVSALDE